MKATNKHAAYFSTSDEVYFINALCGVTLEVTANRQQAIKEFILNYKDRVASATLWVLKGGKKYLCNPSGSAADYN